MAKYSGKNLVVSFKPDTGPQAGVQLDISGKYRTFEVAETAKIADVTSEESTYEEYVSIHITGAKSTYHALDTDTELVSDPFGALANGVQGILTWSPSGTASGHPKRYALAIVMSRKVNWPYDNAVTIDAEFQIAGNVTETVYV